MKRAKLEEGSNTMDRISVLPKEILQRILYFLSQEEAVRTSVLSKSWRYIWCTRPNLDFSDTTFKGNRQEFISVVNNSLHRYYDQRLCLEEFHLSLSIGYKESLSLLNKWIPLLDKLLADMGVKEFHLSILSERLSIDLPSVVFKAESLKLLHLKGCLLFDKIPENTPFERLQVLRLHNVSIENQIFDKMISSCRFLTTMFFENCWGLQTIKLEKKLHEYLKHFAFINKGAQAASECSIEIDIPTLETIEIVGSKVRFHDHKFGNLKLLTLKTVEFYSNSIEQSQIRTIDAPNIEYFEYSGFVIPSISFTPTLRRSKLELYFRWDNVDDVQSWFLRLAKLLQALSQSEIHLNIGEIYRDNPHVQEDILMQEILIQDITDASNKPVVMEHLQFSVFRLSLCPSFLNVLSYICRPVKITHRWNRYVYRWNQKQRKELCEFFSKIQEMGESGNQGIMRDLEDLSIERWDTSRGEWHPLLGMTLLECASLDINNLRFRLKWREACESEC